MLHKSLEALDASKLITYMSCPRMFLWRHVLGLRVDNVNPHIEFGRAWHKALESLLRSDYSESAVNTAFEVFMDEYTASGGEPIGYKTPHSALQALHQYAIFYKDDRRKHKVLHTEVLFSVPISVPPDEERVLYGRFDAIVQDEHGLWVLEHKTTSRQTQVYFDSWDNHFQIGLYLFALWLIFGTAYKPCGVKLNVTIFKKDGPTFVRQIIRKSYDQLESWLYDARAWLARLNYDLQVITMLEAKDETVLQAFPRATPACGLATWKNCQYIDLCANTPNPLVYLEDTPIGFVREYWDVRDEPAKQRKTIGKEVQREDVRSTP